MNFTFSSSMVVVAMVTRFHDNQYCYDRLLLFVNQLHTPKAPQRGLSIGPCIFFRFVILSLRIGESVGKS